MYGRTKAYKLFVTCLNQKWMQGSWADQATNRPCTSPCLIMLCWEVDLSWLKTSSSVPRRLSCCISWVASPRCDESIDWWMLWDDRDISDWSRFNSLQVWTCSCLRPSNCEFTRDNCCFSDWKVVSKSEGCGGMKMEVACILVHLVHSLLLLVDFGKQQTLILAASVVQQCVAPWRAREQWW